MNFKIGNSVFLKNRVIMLTILFLLMVYKYYQNPIQLLANELKRYILPMITLRTGKVICSVCGVKISNKVFCW